MANLLWSQEFNAPLDLKTPSNPSGLFMPTDFWQSNTRGYADFAGQSWNINPNDPAFAGYDPFSVTPEGYLQIEIQRTPAALNSVIASEMSAQGQTGPVPQWMGGILITNPADVQFTSGYIEFKARYLDLGKGAFPALWMFSALESSGAPGTSNAEIDLSEIFGVPNQIYTNTHGGPAPGQVGTISNADTANWHTYGIDRHPDHIDIYRDGQMVYSITGPEASYFNGVPMGLRMNFSADAPWFSSSAHSDSSTPNHMFMQVDYVRQYDTFPGANAPAPTPDPTPTPTPEPNPTPEPVPGTDDNIAVSAAKWASKTTPIDLGGGNDTLSIVVTDSGNDIHTLGGLVPLNIEHLNLYGQPGSDWFTVRGDQLDAILSGPDVHIDLGGGWNVLDLRGTSVALNNLGADDSRIHNVNQFEAAAGVTIDMHGQSEAFKFYGHGDNDSFIGGSGNDVLVGRGSGDYLDGGGGHDILTGGPGAETFIAHNDTTITNFAHGLDHIKVAAGVNLANISWTENGGSTIVHVDATTTLMLTGVGHHLDHNDFSK